MTELKGKDDVKFSHHYYFSEEMKTGPACLKTKNVTIAIPVLTAHTKRKTL